MTLLSAALIAFSGCGNHESSAPAEDITQPRYLEIIPLAGSGWTLVSISPFDGSRDTLTVTEPLRNLIVMSTSHVGFLDAIGRTDVISGVSGLDYVFVRDTTPLHPRGGLRGVPLKLPEVATLRGTLLEDNYLIQIIVTKDVFLDQEAVHLQAAQPDDLEQSVLGVDAVIIGAETGFCSLRPV